MFWCFFLCKVKKIFVYVSYLLIWCELFDMQIMSGNYAESQQEKGHVAAFAHSLCAFSIETPNLYACMRPTGDARLPSTYCPTCQRLCSQQDSRLAPTKSHCWASHRAKLRAGSHWQLWQVKPANVLFLSFQSASRILCIYLFLTNCLQPAQKAGFTVLSAWL